MAINDVYKVTVVFDVPDMPDDGTINFHVQETATTIENEGTLACMDVLAAFTDTPLPLLLDVMTETSFVREIKVRMPLNLEQGADSGSIDQEGTIALAGAAILPVQMAAIVAKKTNFIGRRFQGRNYMPPVGEVNWLGNGFDGGYRSDLITFWNSTRPMTSPATGNEYTLIVWSEEAGSGKIVSNLLVRIRPGVMRKRAK